jgi:NitT/TauT family transport system substrate-binding protein
VGRSRTIEIGQVGVGRAVAKARVFIRASPDGAAYAYLQMFPESAPKVSSLDQQIAAIKIPIEKRQEFFSSYDPATQC